MTPLPDAAFRLDVLGARNLRPANGDAQSNPFVCVLWRADEWALVGQTLPLAHTLSPRWDAESGSSVIVPPVWRAGPVRFLDSGVAGWVSSAEGGWVGRSYEADLYTAARTMSALSLIEARQRRPPLHDAAVSERERLVEALTEALVLEEEARRDMWGEELAARDRHPAALLASSGARIQEQRLLAKELALMQANLQHKSNLLGRLRFLLGESFAGSVAYYCQDPASGATLRLFLVATRYAEDEAELSRQTEALLLGRWTGVVRLLECSVHALRSFSAVGAPVLAGRVCAVVTDERGGAPLDQHMRLRWSATSARELRDLLLQVADALQRLHGAGILHRNLSPSAVLVRRVDGRLQCELRDFFFLYNSRVVGCSYSQGRADWGNADALPPEVAKGQGVTAKSDVYALGVCAYAWAMSGHAAAAVAHTRGAALMARSLPPRWGSWLARLLLQCLEPREDLRASAAAVHQFLLSVRVA